MGFLRPAAGAIISRLPETTVVMLAASANDDDLLDALRAGVAGYLPKGINPDRLLHRTRVGRA